MKIPSVAVALLFAVCLAVLSACGGGGEGDLGEREVGDELERALQSVAESDLAIMVLSQEDLGEAFADLEIGDEAGFVDNEEAADGTIDPDDTADDLQQAGRINGYKLAYENPDFLSALEAAEGVIGVETTVALFKNSEAASRDFAKRVDDYRRSEGEEIETGVTLDMVDTFAVSGLGDEAVGLRERASFGDVQFYGTVVGFRLDRLVGSAVVARADSANVNSQVEAIARALEDRIRGVLLGDIGAAPATPSAVSTGKIAYESDRDGNYEVYVMSADGSGLTRLTNNPASDFAPAWSP